MRTDRVHDAMLERLLGGPDLAADDALIALADRFAGCDRAAVLTQLDDVARGLFGAAELRPREQADMLASALRDTLGLRPVTHDHRALLVDHALATRRAHPLVLAAVGHELGRRAGLTTRICRVQTDWWLTLPGDEVLTALGCSPGSTHPCGPLTAICPHQLAYALLAHLGHDGPPTDRRFFCAPCRSRRTPFVVGVETGSRGPRRRSIRCASW